MPTNFPSSVDALTNPVAGDGLNSPSHSGQHANANDAIEAIEGYLLTGVGTNQLIKITPSSATGGTISSTGTVTTTGSVSSITVNGVFSSTYDDYKMIFTGPANIGGQEIRMTFGGITTGYYSTGAFYEATSSTVSGFNGPNQAFFSLGYSGTQLMRYEMDLHGVNSSRGKVANVQWASYDSTTSYAGDTYLWSVSTATATAMTISIASSTLATGCSLKVYGLKK